MKKPGYRLGPQFTQPLDPLLISHLSQLTATSLCHLTGKLLKSVETDFNSYGRANADWQDQANMQRCFRSTPTSDPVPVLAPTSPVKCTAEAECPDLFRYLTRTRLLLFHLIGPVTVSSICFLVVLLPKAVSTSGWLKRHRQCWTLLTLPLLLVSSFLPLLQPTQDFSLWTRMISLIPDD